MTAASQLIRGPGLIVPNAPRLIVPNRKLTPFPPWLIHTSADEAIDGYQKALAQARVHGKTRERETWRVLLRGDVFFLLVFGMNQPWVAEHDFAFERCREWQESPDGHLDIWFREGYKSTIITVGGTVLNILNYAEVTAGIFSHTRPIAKAFLTQIKRELEQNEKLIDLFPDVLYKRPDRESPKWSEDEGIVVKRQTNPKEATVEAWGLVDGQPTSKHFMLLCYDDTVTRESVYTPEQIKKTTAAWELSLNLGSRGGVRRYIGTRYHMNDTYSVMMQRGIPARRYAATVEGTYPGTPVLHTAEALAQKYEEMGMWTFSAQMLQDPTADAARKFDPTWLEYWPGKPWNDMNRVLLVDPSSGKKRQGVKNKNDYTSMQVWGLGADRNYYCLFLMRDRLNLSKRWWWLKKLHQDFNLAEGGIVGYEEYGMQADIEHFESKMRDEQYRFPITPLGGNIPKRDRIEALMPLFEAKRIYLPEYSLFTTQDGRTLDGTRIFREEEYVPYPLLAHDDMLDCAARIKDAALGASFPVALPKESAVDAKLREVATGRYGGSWISD